MKNEKFSYVDSLIKKFNLDVITPKFKVMIIEDDPVYSMLLDYEIFKYIDCSVKIIRTKKQCIQSISWDPDIILMDYYLPDGNGLDLIKELKQITPNTKVIALSNQMDCNITKELFKEGIFKYFSKDETLFNIISQLKEEFNDWVKKT